MKTKKPNQNMPDSDTSQSEITSTDNAESKLKFRGTQKSGLNKIIQKFKDNPPTMSKNMFVNLKNKNVGTRAFMGICMMSIFIMSITAGHIHFVVFGHLLTTLIFIELVSLL